MLMNSLAFLATCVIPKQVPLKWDRIAVFYSGTVWHNSAVQWRIKWSIRSRTLKRSFRNWLIYLRLAKCWSCPRCFKGRTEAKGCSFHLQLFSVHMKDNLHWALPKKNSIRPYEFHPVLHQIFSDYSFSEFLLLLYTLHIYAYSPSRHLPLCVQLLDVRIHLNFCVLCTCIPVSHWTGKKGWKSWKCRLEMVILCSGPLFEWMGVQERSTCYANAVHS